MQTFQKETFWVQRKLHQLNLYLTETQMITDILQVLSINEYSNKPKRKSMGNAP